MGVSESGKWYFGAEWKDPFFRRGRLVRPISENDEDIERNG